MPADGVPEPDASTTLARRAPARPARLFGWYDPPCAFPFDFVRPLTNSRYVTCVSRPSQSACSVPTRQTVSLNSNIKVVLVCVSSPGLFFVRLRGPRPLRFAWALAWGGGGGGPWGGRVRVLHSATSVSCLRVAVPCACRVWVWVACASSVWQTGGTGERKTP